MPRTMDQAPVQEIAIAPAADAQHGPIQQSEEYLQQLRALVHTASTLQESGYTLQQFSGPELDKKRRCQQCSRTLPAKFKKLGWLPKAAVNANSHDGRGPAADTNSCPPSGDNDNARSGGIKTSPSASSNKPQQPIIRCKFHPGRVAQKKWTCCSKGLFSPPCKGEEDHAPRTYANNELAQEWRFYSTPPFKSATAPAVAIAIDCEMGSAVSGESELIRLSVVDYFSSTVLLDSLVWPDVRMAHYNTRFSGVTRHAMENAKRSRTCIFGRANARKALWKFIGPDTIVVGHAGHQDLTSLRWIHPEVIDTLIIETSNRPPPKEKETVPEKTDTAGDEPQPKEGHAEGREDGPDKPKEGGGLSLKALALQRLNRTIQVKGRGHNSLEDSIATRDILHWNVTNLMEKSSQVEVASG